MSRKPTAPKENVNNVNNVNRKVHTTQADPPTKTSSYILPTKATAKLTDFFSSSKNTSSRNSPHDNVTNSNVSKVNNNSNNSVYNKNTNVNKKNITCHQNINTVHNCDSLNPIFITATSDDGNLQLKINVHEILHLSEPMKTALRQSTEQFLLTTPQPLLYISKKMNMNSLSRNETYHHNTQGSGFCYFIMLLQLRNRHQMKYQCTEPVEIDIFNNPQHRRDLVNFINEMISTSEDPNGPDMNPLKKARESILNQNLSLDSTDYMNLESLHQFNFPFPVTGWAKQSPLDDYLSLIYSNTAGNECKFAAFHAISTATFQLIADSPNDFHHNNDHFYSVPIVDLPHERTERLTQAIRNIKTQVINILLRQNSTPPSEPTDSIVSSSINQVTIARNWMRISLHIPTIVDLTPSSVLLGCRDPLRLLLEPNSSLFHVERNTAFAQGQITGDPSYVSLSPVTQSYQQIQTGLRQAAIDDKVDSPDAWLLRGLTTLARRLLILISQVSTNYIPYGPTVTHMKSIKGSDRNDIIVLEIASDKLQLYYSYTSVEEIYQSLITKTTPTISILKKLQSEHSAATLPNGHCFPLALHQSWQRSLSPSMHLPKTYTITPPCLQHILNTTDRATYKRWLLKLKQESDPSSSDLRKQLQDIHDLAHQPNPRSHWFDPLVICNLLIPWRTTLWTQSTNLQYSAPSWSNRMDEEYKAPKLLSSFNHEQILKLLRGTNDIELSNNHFYLLPSNDPALLLTSMDEALCNLAVGIFQTLQTSRGHQSSSNTLCPSPSNPVINLDDSTEDEGSHHHNVTQRPHAFFEPSYRTYDLESLTRTSVKDPFFRLPSSRETLLQQLKVSTNVAPSRYPDDPIRKQLFYLLERTTAKRSTICDEMGLFANLQPNTLIQLGELIGIYSGPRTTQRNSYTMYITRDFEVGDTPDPTDDWTKFGYINEYIWSRDKCNCIIGEHGAIRATRTIHHGEELFISYGLEYQWDHLKTQYHYSLVDAIVSMSKLLPSAPPETVIRETYLSALQSVFHTEFKQLLTHFFAHDANDPRATFPIHNSLPSYSGGSVLEWIEIVLRCRWFYEQQCFRKHQDPRQQIIGIQKPDEPTNQSEPLRRSSRSKPIVSYIDNQDSDDDERGSKRRGKCTHVQYYLQLQTLFPVTLLYQCTMLTDPTYSDSSTITPPLMEVDHNTLTTQDNEEPICAKQGDEPMDVQQGHGTQRINSHTHSSFIRPVKVSPSEDDDAARLDALADTLVPPRQRQQRAPSSLTTMSFNMNGLCELKEREIVDLIHKHSVDITTLVDVRVSVGSEASYKFRLRRQIGTGYAIMVFPTQPDDRSTQLIGGTVVILSRRIDKHSAVQLIPLGSLIQLSFSFGTQRIALFAIYVPTRNSATGSYKTRIANACQVPPSQVHDILFQALSDAVISMQSQSTPVIVTGDFNRNLAKGKLDQLTFLFDHLRLQHAATLTELEQSSYESGQLGTANRKTTRIDFTLYHGNLRPTKCTCATYPTYQNDHIPIITIFDIPGQSRAFEPVLSKPGVVRYDYRDPKHRETFEKLMTSINTYPDLSPSERITLITEQTVAYAAIIRPPRGTNRGYKPNVWSPENRSLVITIEAIVLINRHVHGYKKYSKWKETDYGSKLRSIRKRWKRDIEALAEDDSGKYTLLHITEFGPDHWVDMSLSDISEQLLVAIPIVRKLSTTKLKQQRRDEYLEKHMRREFKFQIQQIGEPINAVLKKHRQVFTMEELIIDERCTALPGRIASAITKKFRDDWFNFPTGSAGIKWSKNLAEKESFMVLSQTLGIKLPEAQILWRAIEKRPTSDRIKTFHETVMQTPTFKEYMTQVNWASIDSAGGMSGLTYAMIKSWPPHVHEEIYKALVENWSNNNIPDDWKWRWLLPIPKVPNPTLSQLRPICLLEVLRKLWSKLFIQRITDFMQKEQILHPGQHSGKGKGTDSAVLEFAAILETAKELNTELFVSSWDVSKAYDSVDRMVLLFAWVRAGVPYALAEYLVRMDVTAVMVVQTPLAMVAHTALGKEGLIEHGLSFHPERGTAQGGVDSSLVYAAFLDILLCAIEIVSDPDDTFYISDIDGNLQPAGPIAYVDDLVCATATAKGLQSVANIVSAFCILFQMELNSSKFRAFAINWGSDHQEEMRTMTIYTKGWTPMTINMQHDGTMTHLGVDWDMSLHNTTMFNRVKQMVRTTLDLVVNSHHSATIRLAAIQISLMNQLVYVTKFTTWSLSQYQEIDILFNKAYRRISHNQRSFPTKLLYMQSSQLGLEYPQFSTQSQLAKYHLLQRSTYCSNTRRQFIINSLTGRVIRQMRCQPCRHGPYSLTVIDLEALPKEDRHTWWFTSLAQHMTLAGITIERDNLANSNLPMHISYEIRTSLVRNSSLVANGISLPQELHMHGDAVTTLHTLGLEWADNLAIQAQPTPIRQGQVWATYYTPTNTYTIFEIVGFLEENIIAYFPWQCLEHLSDGTPTKVSLTNGTGAMRGAGSAHTTDMVSLFSKDPDLIYYLVNLGKEIYIPGANISSCKAFRKRTPLVPQLNQAPYIHSWFLNLTSEISTHSMIKQTNTIVDRLMGHTRSDVTSVLIKTDQSSTTWIKHALIVKHEQLYMTSKSANVLALYVAASQSPHARQTYTSTTKCGQTLHRKAATKPVADPLTPILQPHKAHRMFPLAPLTETQSSILKQLKKDPNKVIALSNNQRQEANLQAQIFIERAINLPQTQLIRHHPGSTTTYAKDVDFTQNLRRSPNGVICNTLDHLPMLECYSTRLLKHMSLSYYSTRDQYRQEVHDKLNKLNQDPRYWTDSSQTLAAAVLNKVPRGSTRAMVTRIVLDWHLTGGNKLKRTLDPHDAQCTLCGAEMENQQHILCHCTHVHMQTVRKTHMDMIEKRINALPKDSFSTKLIKAFHREATQHSQYELLLGRIHPHLVQSIASLPEAKSSEQATSAYITLVAHCRQYFAMAIDLYQTRQKIIDQQERDPEWQGTLRNFDPVRQRILTSESLMMGISKNHFLNPDGTKTIKQNDGPISDTISNKRKTLNETNSVFCRKESDFFAKRSRIEETRQEKIRDSKALKLITLTDQQEWNNMYASNSKGNKDVTESVSNTNNKTSSSCNTNDINHHDNLFLQRQSIALQLYSDTAKTIFPELAQWFVSSTSNGGNLTSPESVQEQQIQYNNTTVTTKCIPNDNYNQPSTISQNYQNNWTNNNNNSNNINYDIHNNKTSINYNSSSYQQLQQLIITIDNDNQQSKVLQNQRSFYYY